jgi:MFS family permease
MPAEEITNKNSSSLVFLVAFRICRSIAAGMIALTFPYLILKSFTHGALILGFLYSSASIATALLGLFFGFLTDIWGRKETLLTVAFLIPLSCFFVLLAHTLPLLFAAAVLGGYSATGSLAGGGVGGAAQPIQNAVLADLTTSENRTKYYSILTFISGILASLGTLLAKLFTLQGAFAAALFISLISILFVIPLKFKKIKGNPKQLKSAGAIGKFTITGILNGFSQGLVTPFLIPFFVLVYHIPKSEMAVYGFISGLIAAVGLLGAPYLEKTFGFVKSMTITRGFGALLMILLPLIKDLPFALAVYFFSPALRIAALPIQQTQITERVNPDEVGRALGTNQVARLASSSGGILMTGYLFDLSEIGVPFYLYGAVMGINTYLYHRFFSGPGDGVES